MSNGDESSLQFLGTEGTLKLDSDGLEFEPEEPIEDNRAIVETWPKALEQKYYENSDVIKTQLEPAREKKEKEREEKEKGKSAEEDDGKITDPDRPHHFKSTGPDATEVHLGHFFDSVRNRKPYWEDAAVGHRAAACAHMINASVKERRMVEWDFRKDDIKS